MGHGAKVLVIVLLILLTGLLGVGVWVYLETRIGLCDGNYTKDWLKRTFDTAQFARTLNLSASRVNDVAETNWDGVNEVRQCTAAIVMNNAKTVRVNYKIFRTPDAGSA